ncbi:hypothetical protein OY671_011417 [Metschnikowia pulcherrima]|nr:hypothetical protein OY671_011417 [Metschnikowia pulcherrima]
MATPADQSAVQRKKQPKVAAADQMARSERESVASQTQVKAVEDSYGVDNLHLTLVQAYLKKSLGNARIVRWSAQRHPEYSEQFQAIAEVSASPA